MVSARAGRWLRRVAAVAITLVVVLLVVATWAYCGQIDGRLLRANPSLSPYDLEVLAAEGGVVTLPAGTAAERPGVWGLEWATGYARVGAVMAVTPEGVKRPLLEVAGTLRPGTMVRVDPLAYESDPSDAGVQYENVIVEGPLGNYSAWRTDGADDTWVILVHGRGSSRREALRVLPTLVAGGFPTLTVTYRNDPGAPDGGGRYGLGNPEWEDLEAAVEYAADEGAADVVLMGYGMGGAIVTLFLQESSRAPMVRALVLDAPLLDAGATVDADARAHNVPGLIVGWAKGLATLRFGVDWGDLNQVEQMGALEVPVLLFHGAGDPEAPVEVSDRFAQLHPGLVRYERTEAEGRAASWNADPARYQAALAAFLDEVAAGPAPEPGARPDEG
jgi:pimeloyl-ACP methyl ester carboxylesterase